MSAYEILVLITTQRNIISSFNYLEFIFKTNNKNFKKHFKYINASIIDYI